MLVETAEIVYDLKGYTYMYDGTTCEKGFIVYPIYPGALYWNGSSVEQEEDEFGDPIILPKIYKQKPVQKLNKEIKELKETLSDLQSQINTKKKELSKLEDEINRLKYTNVDELITERLKEVKNADILIKALTHKLFEFGVTPDNVPYSHKYNTVAVEQLTGTVFCLQYNSNTETFEISDTSSTKYKTLEEAERYVVEQVNKQFSDKPKHYADVKVVDALFDKYDIARSSYWKKHAGKIKHGYIEDIKDEIKRMEQRIRDNRSQIEKYEQQIKSL